MTEPVRVDVPGLRTLGGEILGHGTELKRDVGTVEGKLVPPVGPGVNGWTSLDATVQASQGWEAYLNGLGGRIEASGQSLIDAANNYQGSDDRAGQRQGGVRPR